MMILGEGSTSVGQAGLLSPTGVGIEPVPQGSSRKCRW